MQNNRRIAGFTGRVRRYLHAFGYVLIATLMGASFLRTATAATIDVQDRVENIAALASSALMLTVAEGPFIMGTARTSHEPFSFDLQYDDTEQPQRRVWLHQYEIDRDEVSLGEYLLWLRQQQRHLPEEVRKLIDHVTTIHALPPETLARWPALYVRWSEASDFCHTRNKRLPTEAEWVEDWFGIDYYATMPDHNPHGPANGRYKVVRGGSWKSAPALLRTATRNGASPDQRAATIGFRCARSAR